MERKIRVLFDELGFIEPHGGVSRLYTEVMRNLPDDFEWRLTAVASANAYLREPPFNLPAPKQTVHDFIRGTLHGRQFPGVLHVYKRLARLFPTRYPSVEWANEGERRKAFKALDFDLLQITVAHPTSEYWRPVVGKRPIVVTVVDLIPELILHDKRVQYYRRKLLTAATHIIAITENTKRDIVRLYGIPEERISVVYLGYNMKVGVDSSVVDIKTRWNLEKNKFVLFVGKRGGYKNFNWMVRALAPMLKDGLKLFCTGTPFSESEKALFSELGVMDRIVQGFVSDAEMKALYENAAAFIHPSLYEGFGIPVLDAFAAGCPALLADASCFPEVGGDAALYFNPERPEDLRTKLAQFLESEEARVELVTKGRERVKSFSWTKCAAETAEIYRRVVG